LLEKNKMETEEMRPEEGENYIFDYLSYVSVEVRFI